MMNIKNLFLSLIVALIGLSQSAQATLTGPTEQMKTTIDPILEILQDKTQSVETKRTQIRELLKKRFDFRAMSQRTLATNWKKATEPQKTRFISLFTKLLEDTYLVMVEEYTDEDVKYVGEKLVKDRYAQIDTLITRKGAPPIPVNYKTRLTGEKWLVYDVVIEGVSMISNYRTSYRQIVQKEGMNGLLAKMEAKLACAGAECQ